MSVIDLQNKQVIEEKNVLEFFALPNFLDLDEI